MASRTNGTLQRQLPVEKPIRDVSTMIAKYLLPLVALGMIVFAVSFLLHSQQPIPQLPPPIEPARNPFPSTVAGAGMVEPETENIAVGSPVAGVVVEVNAKVGKRVKIGDPLFRLDDRQLRAELEIRKAMLADAQSQLDKLTSMPRPEELPQSEARVRETQADNENMQQQLARAEKLAGTGAMTEEEIFDRKQLALQAFERYNRAVADFNLLKAGAWEPDKHVAQAAADHARAQIQQTQIDLDLLVVRALVDGEVLQVNVRPGEFVGAPANQALVVLGSTTQLNVRVDIDEYDIPRFVTDAPARATLKGHADNFYPLKFVRVEPYVVPKKSLTGDNTERVDTRVLQVIYAIDAQGQRLFVGQQVDVFIDAGATAAAADQAAAETRR
jgi:HlyD family secretion protein